MRDSEPSGGCPSWAGFLQVSELVKLIIIVVLARFFSEVRTDDLSWRI
jgi:cell division protein FtsW (lipid II flippase)